MNAYRTLAFGLLASSCRSCLADLGSFRYRRHLINGRQRAQRSRDGSTHGDLPLSTVRHALVRRRLPGSALQPITHGAASFECSHQPQRFSMTFLYVFSMVLTVMANVAYHFCQKEI